MRLAFVGLCTSVSTSSIFTCACAESSLTGCAVVGFVLCTIPKLHYYTLIVSTGFVGATAFMLGVDCYTTAGLKEACVFCFFPHLPC